MVIVFFFFCFRNPYDIVKKQVVFLETCREGGQNSRKISRALDFTSAFVFLHNPIHVHCLFTASAIN